MGMMTESLIRDEIKKLITEQKRTNQLLEHMCKQLNQLIQVTQGQPKVWAGQ